MTLAPIGSRFTGRRAWGRVVAPSLKATVGDLGAAALDKITGGKRRDRHIQAEYRRILRQARCKRVIGIQPPDPLVEACRELEIPVFDLQHGAIGPGNGYYERLGRGGQWLRFLVWDEASRAALAEDLGVAAERIEIAGNPWLELHRDPPPGARDLLVTDQERAREALGPESGKPVILVTLQWAMDELHPADFDNPSVPRGLSEALAKVPEVLWWIRPHPMHPGSANLAGDNIRWCDPRQVSLPAALALSDGHVTWDSSAVIESVLCGVPSLVLSAEAHVEKGVGGEIARPDAASPRAFERYRDTGLVSWASRGSRVSDIIAFAHRLEPRR